MALGALLVRWLVSALVTMVAVGMVTPRNPANTLTRALFVTFLVAIVVTPFAFFWFLLIPGIIALIAWFIVYTAAYHVRFGQALAIGIVQAAIGWLVDFFLVRGRLG